MENRKYKTVEAYHLESGGGNSLNPNFPVLIYGGVLEDGSDSSHALQRIFSENAWNDFHHRTVLRVDQLHSGAHEVLGIVSGSAVIRMGGSLENQFELEEGDLILIPAGTVYRMISGSSDFDVVSAVPEGQEATELIVDDGNAPIGIIARNPQMTPIPKTDPYFGHDGPLFDFWYG